MMTAKGEEFSGRSDSGQTRLDEEDFHRLYPKLVAHFRRLGCAAEDTRDLAQETLLQAWESLRSFKGDSDLDTWVVSIAKLVWLQDIRSRGRKKRKADEISVDTLHPSTGPTSGAPGPEEVTVGKDLLTRTTESMRELPEAMRQALQLYVAGHKYRSIAILLGISENQVSSLIHQARAKLRRKVPT